MTLCAKLAQTHCGTLLQYRSINDIMILASHKRIKSIVRVIASFDGSNTPVSKPRLFVLSVLVYLSAP